MILTLTGTNSFLLRDELRKRTAAFVQAYGDFGLERLSAEETEYPRLLESVQAMPFLAEKRMVIIDAPAANKQLAEHIEQFLDAVNEQTDLLLVEPKFDKRSSMYKTLKKQTDFTEYGELDEVGLARWLGVEAKSQGGGISSQDARYLVQRVGTNQLRLSNELAKLLSYDDTVTRQSIEHLTVQTPQSTTFELLEAAFAGNAKRTLALYDEQRRQKVEPQAILALLAWQLHALAVVKAAGNTPANDVASQAKLNPFVVRKTQPLARSIEGSKLKQLIHQALELDIRLKSEVIDADAALQELLIAISNRNLHK